MMPDECGGLRLSRRVAFTETDAAGIVHFSNYFRYFEDAEHALWREAGLRIHAADSTIGWPRVSVTCDYHRPLEFEQEFEICVSVAEITGRTIRYEGTIVRNGERVARATWKVACVVRLPGGGMKSTNIPADVVGRLAPFHTRSS